MARPEHSGLERVLICMGAVVALPFILLSVLVVLPFSMLAAMVAMVRRQPKPKPKTPLEEGREILAGFLEEQRAGRDAQGPS